MANQKQLDLLRQGVEVWNTWRQEHPEVQPDLREAFLKGASLHGANFTGADLPLQLTGRCSQGIAMISDPEIKD